MINISGVRPWEGISSRWSLTLKIDRATCNIEFIDMAFKKIVHMGQAYFLDSTCDIYMDKRQRHATLTFS